MGSKGDMRFASARVLRRAQITWPKAVLVAFVLLVSVRALGAQTAGTIVGTVRDKTGAVLTEVQLTARHLDTGLTRSTVSHAEGSFVFAAMPVGPYAIRAELSGFRPLVHKGVHLTVGETADVDLTMELGSFDQEITVVARTSLVNTRSSELSYLVSEESIRELPLNGRNYTDLALLQPGVIAFPHRSGGSIVAHGLAMSVNGQDPRSNVYLLDGTPQNDFTNGPAGSAAGTALGVETIREVRVEANAYSAEFGRNSGGQFNALTKSGTNEYHGSLYHFHRNDNLDARNFFDLDPGTKPEFKRNQFGASLGGPLRRDRTFFFFGYEALRERKGRSVTTIVPDEEARRGIINDMDIGINEAVNPYLDEFPFPNGENLLDPQDKRPTGLAVHRFGFNEQIGQDFTQIRMDHNVGATDRFFARYTYDDADQQLPTDFPQFPRAFLSRNQFVTAEYQKILSPRTLNTFRTSFSRTRIGQDVEANVSLPLQPFVPGQDKIGAIDIGGIPRFGPQISVNVSLVQNVFGFEYGMVHSRGRHLLKLGALAERYQDNMFNPTFSLGIFRFDNLPAFLNNQPEFFLGLAPGGALDRYWRFTLFGFYAQDDIRVAPRLTVNLGVRYEFATLPRDLQGRDSTLLELSDTSPTTGQLYQNPTLRNLSPRVGCAWDVFGDGKTSLRSGYGIFFNTNNQQNLIVTVTNPPATRRIVISEGLNPTFPVPSFERAGADSIRPIEWKLKNPYVHVWNLNLQRELGRNTAVMVGYAGSRGIHLLRSGDVNIATPERLDDGTLSFPVERQRPNSAFSTIELKRSDGNSWYNALIVEVRRRWSKNVSFQSSYTFSRNIDTTQASTFFSDATNGTTSAFPEFPGLNYNKGLADFHAKHNWVMNFIWNLPDPKLTGLGRLLEGWELAGIAHVRSGNPLTAFVQRNRSRSLWQPSLGPGLGFDRPSMAPGRTHQDAVLGNPDGYFDPAAFVLQPAGTLGNLGRGALIGPNLRSFDLAAVKKIRWSRLGDNTNIEFRAEVFNLLNRANFASPGLLAYAGRADLGLPQCPLPNPDEPNEPTCEEPLASLGRIRSTVTSSRQIQLGLRISF